MKITDPDVIKNGEKDLIKAVMDDLDLDAIQKILIQKMAAQTLSAKGGEIVVHNNEIAYRLDFETRLSGSLMFDRQGNYISESDDDETLISEDFDLDDINIDEPLEEVAPQAPLNDDEEMETKDTDIPEEDLSIDLPEYDLDDELDPDTEDDEGEKTQEDDIEDEKDDLIQDEIVDDDISDILEESREFWDQKKD